MTTKEVGTGLVIGGVLFGGASAVMYWVASTEDWHFGPLIAAMVSTLLAVYLIGYGIKKLVS